SLEIATRPECESEEPGCPSARQMVVLRCKSERLPRIGYGRWHIAPSQGHSGMSDRDRTRETAKCLVVHDDHPSTSLRTGRCCWGARWRPRVRRRVQPLFGVTQALMGALEHTARQ